MSDDEWIGPKPEEAADFSSKPPRKKLRVLEHESLYLESLPSAEYYEKSYMHRDIVTHIVVTCTDFVVTGSCDGHVKFWKKQEMGIEFVKYFRAHLGPIQNLAANTSGTRLASISTDKTLKIFDVENFDMINMVKFNFVPLTCEWISKSSDVEHKLAVSDAEAAAIYLFDAHGNGLPYHTIDNIYTKPVILMKCNHAYGVTVSMDEAGMIEYWCGHKDDYSFPSFVKFQSKLDTDLYEFVKQKVLPKALTISTDGKRFATIGSDKKIRVFNFLSGKLTRVYDESIEHSLRIQQKNQQIGNMEFGRRLAIEREFDKGGTKAVCSILFDESGHFLIYPTMLGIKIINLVSNKLVRTIGRPENLRLLYLALHKGQPSRAKGTVTAELQAADNPTLEAMKSDPTIVATAFKKNRFYLFTKRDATDPKHSEGDRDVFNEKPSREDIISATDAGKGESLYDTAILHTTLGDIQLKLFMKECPKAVENFCVHAKNGYFTGHIFHRVIKQFMIQTGDPQGTGVGGESIWGGEFEDEFHPSLKHDRPYTLSMANAGPNTNGSQFFITVVPAPWLDNKHTVFGRVTRGLEVVQNISNAKTNPKTDKPYDDISIVSVTVK